MAWTTPRTWVASEIVNDATLNTHVRDNLNAIVNPPYVHVRAASTTTTIGTTIAGVQWDTEVADTDNMYSAGTNTRVTINTAGLYLVQGGYGVAGAASSTTPPAAAAFNLAWMVNSTSTAISQAGSSVYVTTLARSIMLHNSTYIRLYANDFVSLGAYHVNAVSNTTTITASYTSWMQLRWVGP
jgi:hypothetical protein